MQHDLQDENISEDDESIHSITEVLDLVAAPEVSRPIPNRNDNETSFSHEFRHNGAFNESYTNINYGAMAGAVVSASPLEEGGTYYLSQTSLSMLPSGRWPSMATRVVENEVDALQPSRRLIKVHPEGSDIRPGAYAYTPSSDGDNNSHISTSIDELTTTEDDTSIILEPPEHVHHVTTTTTTTTTIQDEPTTTIQDMTSTRIEQTRSTRTHKSNKRHYKWIGAGILLGVMVIIGVGTGVGVSRSHIRSRPPSKTSSTTDCSMNLVTEECTANGNTLPMGPPACIMARYTDLTNNFIPILNVGMTIDPTSCSPENLALISLALFTTTDPPPPQQQDSWTGLTNRFGLSIFYFATNGADWISNDGWISPTTSHCDWYGIECGPSNNVLVKAIRMPWNNLHGYLPSMLPILLRDLRDIMMENNALSGTLPEEFGALEHINVGFNALSGVFPSETLFASNQTVSLLVHNNNFDLSPMPGSAATTPTTTTPTTTSFRGTQWQALSLNELNFESGPFPMGLFSQTMLTVLSMSNTNLVGTIPSEIGQLTRLEQLILQQNSQLQGTLPSEIGHSLTLLSVFDLSLCSISGTIPSEMGQLTELTMFDVEYNNFSGTMPTELGLLTNLEQFTFSSNTFSGTVPSEVCHLRNNNSKNKDKNKNDDMAILTTTKLTTFGSVLCDPARVESIGGLMCPPNNIDCCNC